MTKLDIAISSMKYSIECSEEESQEFQEIAKSLNKRTNELMMSTGKISDRLILFTILLINANKKEKIFNNFQNNILELLKNIAPLLNITDNLDAQLILANIIKENETKNLIEENINNSPTNEETKKILEESNKNCEDTIKFIDEIINFIEKLANNINRM